MSVLFDEEGASVVIVTVTALVFWGFLLVSSAPLH